MKLVPVKSSNVEAVGYDPDKRTMHVRFKGGATYIHHDVEPAHHAAFVSAPSVGAHYHTHFKGRFGVKKVGPTS